MDHHLSYVFLANVFFILVDATIGYHAAPALSRLGGVDQSDAEWTVRGVRKLLAGVVTLYTFFNCLAFFDQKPWFLYFVSAVLAVDIAAQLIICRKMTLRGKL